MQKQKHENRTSFTLEDYIKPPTSYLLPPTSANLNFSFMREPCRRVRANDCRVVRRGFIMS